jgi:hypothetical protein
MEVWCFFLSLLFAPSCGVFGLKRALKEAEAGVTVGIPFSSNESTGAFEIL